MPFTSSFIALGVDDAINTCDHCGKRNLKCTVALEAVETGEVVHYGRDCAGAALYGRKSRSNTGLAEVAARRAAKAAPIVAFVKAGFDAGRRDLELVTEANKLARSTGADRFLSIYRTVLGGRDCSVEPTAYTVQWDRQRVRFDFEGAAELIDVEMGKAA